MYIYMVLIRWNPLDRVALGNLTIRARMFTSSFHGDLNPVGLLVYCGFGKIDHFTVKHISAAKVTKSGLYAYHDVHVVQYLS